MWCPQDGHSQSPFLNGLPIVEPVEGAPSLARKVVHKVVCSFFSDPLPVAAAIKKCVDGKMKRPYDNAWTMRGAEMLKPVMKNKHIETVEFKFRRVG